MRAANEALAFYLGDDADLEDRMLFVRDVAMAIR